MAERYMFDERGEGRQYDPEMLRFNASMALLISGELQALGDELKGADDDGPDEAGKLAVLRPYNGPPHISSIALRQPGHEPLVTLVAV